MRYRPREQAGGLLGWGYIGIGDCYRGYQDTIIVEYRSYESLETWQTLREALRERSHDMGI